jgi:large subunit ribosomal protein L10
VQKEQKELVVSELTERLRTAQSLIVADYRGLTMPQIDNLRTELLKHGAKFTVVKNTLTRRAAEAAGGESLLALLEGPTAIAFLETDGDPVAVAKALGAAARETRMLEVRGGVLEGRVITPADVESLAKLPPFEQLRGQVVGAMTSPLYAVVGLFNAPLRNLVGLIDARIEQLHSTSESTSGTVPEGDSPQPEAASEADVGGPEDPQTRSEDPTAAVVAETEGTVPAGDSPEEEEKESE